MNKKLWNPRYFKKKKEETDIMNITYPASFVAVCFS